MASDLRLYLTEPHIERENRGQEIVVPVSLITQRSLVQIFVRPRLSDLEEVGARRFALEESGIRKPHLAFSSTTLVGIFQPRAHRGSAFRREEVLPRRLEGVQEQARNSV